MSQAVARSHYRKLLAEITALHREAGNAVVMFYWSTGKRLVEVEQNGEVKAAYGASLLKELSADLTRNCGPDAGFSVVNLQRMRRFYLSHPKYSASTKLSWSQHVELMSLKDGRARARLEQRAAKEKMATRDIRRLVKEARGGRETAPGPAASPAKKLPPLKAPADLTLYTYQKLPGEGGVLVDCGFFVCLEAAGPEAGHLTLTQKPSYTYAAAVERVVDGDTLKVTIALGFGIFVREKLRLRGVNTPELGTTAGQKAKRHVESLLPAGSPVILKSHQTDIYGRFVADVFFGPGARVPRPASVPKSRALKTEDLTYLNQKLLDDGHAVRMEE